MSLARWLHRQWYEITLWHILLWPASLLFGVLVLARRALYRLGWLTSERLPVPVVVVGNILVGGTGKTPVVLWLAAFLKAQGMKPGIVSRGYGGQGLAPRAALPDSDPQDVGDEPVLLARRSNCPVWVGVDRAATGKALLAAHPECDVVLCDDGLQHYRLARDAEVAVVDYRRRFGNGFLLPAGPLREPVLRLGSVDAVVVNGAAWLENARQVAMTLRGETFYNLRNPARTVGPEQFAGKRVHALAGIGHPERFFEHLEGLGVKAVRHPFPDHHPFVAGDLNIPEADAILMTEKDAVKCQPFASPYCWALAVTAEIDPALGYRILDKIKKAEHGRKTA